MAYSSNSAVVIIIRDGENRFLMGKRSANRSWAPLYWSPISGTIEENEKEEDAVIREALEEAGLCVKPIERVAVSRSEDISFTLYWWIAEIISGIPEVMNDELCDIKWFSAEELVLLSPLLEEDRKILLNIAKTYPK